MIFANLSGLKEAVADWINRDDVSDARIESFVRLGEEQIGLFLRSRYNQKTERVFVDTTGLITIPDDYVELISMQPAGTWDGASQSSFEVGYQPALTPVSYNSMTGYSSMDNADAPVNFSEVPSGDAWFVYPAGNWAIDVSYFSTLAPLTDTAPFPALFVRHGGMYLSAAMIEYENFLKLEPNERGPWQDKLNAYITKLNNDQRRVQLSGGTLVTRSPYR